MSREAFGDPPESQEPPQVCPVCGGEWHAEDCEFGKEVARRLKAERDAHRLAVEERTLRLRYGVVSDWIVRALKVLDTLDPEDSTEADELGKLIAAGEMLALTTLANSKTPNKPLRRGVDGVCTRSTCECEREGLGDQCVWLGPAEAEFECLGEPSLCANPRGCACVPDSKTPNSCFDKKQNAALIGVIDKHNTEMNRLLLARKLAQWLVNGDEPDEKTLGWNKAKIEGGVIGTYSNATQRIIQAEQARMQMEEIKKYEEWKFRESERLQQEMMLKYPPMIGLTTTAPKSWK